MREQAGLLKDILRKQEGVWDVHDTWGAPTQQLYVDVDPDRANLAGVTNESVAKTLAMYYSGDYVTTFREQDHLVPVYLRLPPEERVSLAQVDTAFVQGGSGSVPLSAVATTETRWAPALIERRFRQRVIEVRARTERGYRENDIVTAMLETPEFQAWSDELPPGYHWEVGGALYEASLNMKDMQTSLLITLLSIVLLLVIQYNGFAKPAIILMTLPLALIGAFPGLYVTGNALGFMAQLGLLSLFGVVVNTAIIFLEFADSLILEKAKASDGSGPICGLTRAEFRECLARAGMLRLLPIAMTTLTTIGGLLPLALWGGPLWEAMSWLMIFGLMVATVLTLVVVPAIYAIMVETFRVKPVQLGEE
jgi:multidrug efflux pump subunit AcrB